MSTANDARAEIRRAINTLRRRHDSTVDAAERKAIVAAIEDLNGELSLLNQSGLLGAASAVSNATGAVERAVAAARKGPFDGYLTALENHLGNLYRLSGDMHAREGLEPAPGEAPAAAAAATAARAGRSLRAGATGLAAPIASKNFVDLTAEYAAWFTACTVQPQYQANVAYYVKRLNQGRTAYEAVGQQLAIPWPFIGIIHGMECGFNFAGHLHNGDPLGARTVQVPAGRPRTGTPPFTWKQSAIDALTLKGYHQVSDWSVPHMLYLLERYNGFGYRMRRVPTPYLWSFSNLYSKGKFVKDGVYDPNAVSKQCGAAVMLQAVMPRRPR